MGHGRLPLRAVAKGPSSQLLRVPIAALFLLGSAEVAVSTIPTITPRLGTAHGGEREPEDRPPSHDAPMPVGDDCVIGPNSVVIRDLPPGSVVLGVPARQAALWKDKAPPPPSTRIPGA